MKAHRIAIFAVFAGFLCGSASGEFIYRQSFDDRPPPTPLKRTWGEKPARIDAAGVERGAGVDRSAGARLRLTFADTVKRNLSYWTYRLPEPVPIAKGLETISFAVKTNVPVSIKIGIRPFAFIYHGPGVKPSNKWQTVRVEGAYAKLKAWCEGGGKSFERGWVDQVIVAIAAAKGGRADVTVDDITLAGPSGSAEAVRREAFRRRCRKTKVAAVSLIWDEGHRTLGNALKALDEAALAGADLACLPQECVYQPPEPIPGPASAAIAARAKRHGMYVVGNLREKVGGKTYVTSFLCDRGGKIVGKYRKSHRMPHEGDIALGDELPVFATDIGPVGMKIGTDHYFPEIDRVLQRRGARLIVWSTAPQAVRDEHFTTLAVRGRAADLGLYYAVARYAGEADYGGYRHAYSWQCRWPIGRAQVIDRDGHTRADSGHRGGVAVATLPATALQGAPRPGGYATTGKYAAITAEKPIPPQPRPKGMKRTVRAAVIEHEPNFGKLLAKLDTCGRAGCDVVCLWEYVWYRDDRQAEQLRERNSKRLRRIADAAKRGRTYVVIAGELERGFNEAILFGRDGKEVGRYTKINQTTSKQSKHYRAGERVGIFDLDFGRVCVKICADVYTPDIDRVAALHQVDLVLLPTQDCGPFTEHTRLRDTRRCVDDGYFLLRAACGINATDHRAYIADPWGVVLAATQYRADNAPLIATLHLDNRPKYYRWPDEVEKAGPYPDPYKRGVSENAKANMYSARPRPLAAGNLRAVILRQRRPSLYQAGPPGKAQR